MSFFTTFDGSKNKISNPITAAFAGSRLFKNGI
jgi:hypothetical protein